MSADPRLDALLTSYLAGDLVGDDARELEARLERDAEARARLAFFCRQDLALHEVLSAPGSAVLTSRRVRSRRLAGRGWTSASAAPRAAVAAVLVAAFTGLLVYAATRRTESPSRSVAVQPPLTNEPPESVKPPDRAPVPPEPELTKEPGSFVRPPAPAPAVPELTKEPGSFVRPAPAPEPEPPPGPKPAAPPTVAAPAAVARLDALEGDVEVLRDGRSRPARELEHVLPGDGLACRNGTAALVFPDGTRVALVRETVLEAIEDAAAGKRMRLARGRLEAGVAKQPAGRAMAIHTAAAEVRVVGTTLAVAVAEGSTRLEVTEGKVRLTRLADKRGVDVPAGYYAVAAPASDLLLRPLRMVDVARVSFGPAQAPLPDGFIADTGTVFDAASGLGWNSDRQQAARLRTGPKTLLERRLIVAGEAREVARWELAVRNGRYYVTLSCGDSQNPQGPHHVAVEGRLVVRETMTAAGEHVVVEDVPVDVRDGRLTLHFGGHGSSKVDPDNTGDTALNYVIVRRAE